MTGFVLQSKAHQPPAVAAPHPVPQVPTLPLPDECALSARLGHIVC